MKSSPYLWSLPKVIGLELSEERLEGAAEVDEAWVPLAWATIELELPVNVKLRILDPLEERASVLLPPFKRSPQPPPHLKPVPWLAPVFIFWMTKLLLFPFWIKYSQLDVSSHSKRKITVIESHASNAVWLLVIVKSPTSVLTEGYEELMVFRLYFGEPELVAWCPFPLLSPQYLTLLLFVGEPIAPAEVPWSIVLRSLASSQSFMDGTFLGSGTTPPFEIIGNNASFGQPLTQAETEKDPFPSNTSSLPPVDISTCPPIKSIALPSPKGVSVMKLGEPSDRGWAILYGWLLGKFPASPHLWAR